MVFQNYAINKVANNSGGKHNKGIDHTLHQAKGDHVTISHMANFMANTARASSSLKRSNSPVLTATRALFLFQPVAKAFDC